jgi:hypothetical protein
MSRGPGRVEKAVRRIFITREEATTNQVASWAYCRRVPAWGSMGWSYLRQVLSQHAESH